MELFGVSLFTLLLIIVFIVVLFSIIGFFMRFAFKVKRIVFLLILVAGITLYASSIV